MMYNFNPEEWQTFLGIFNNSELTNAYTSVADKINSVNTFLGINLTMTPMQQLWPAIFIPILAGGLQWLSSWLMQRGNGKKSNSQDQQQSICMVSAKKSPSHVWKKRRIALRQISGMTSRSSSETKGRA